jgi:hypothetical protein
MSEFKEILTSDLNFGFVDPDFDAKAEAWLEKIEASADQNSSGKKRKKDAGSEKAKKRKTSSDVNPTVGEHLHQIL